jgi:two-component system, NtrC family, response regulator HydG
MNTNGKPHILVVDDEPLIRHSLSELLTLSGYTVSSASNGKEALRLLKDYNTDVIITDIKMPEMDGRQLLKQIKSLSPETPVILVTGYGSIENAVEAMKDGAYDYITKPIVDSEIKIVLDRIIKQRQIQEENLKLKKQLSKTLRESFHGIVGKTEQMQKIYNLIEAISTTRATVLISGESGTGKRLIAHAIHKCNALEREKPFVEISCGALTETLLESELFGHVKGAFTGAIKDKPGRFEVADGGSIFLDEIDAFSLALQVKLLRVLQEGEFERVGDNKTLKVDVRVIAATNQNLQELIVHNKFRKDLYYRLNIISIEIPPLRERKEDIPLLINALVLKHTKHTSKKIERVDEATLKILMNYQWPGNIRELENVIERAVILSKSNTITADDLPEFLRHIKYDQKSALDDGLKLKDALRSPEKDLIVKALEAASWNRNDAAKALGINRTTLYKKMRHSGLLKKKARNE